MKITADRHDAHVEIVDPQRAQEGFVRAVADLRVRDYGEYRVYPVLVPVDRQDLMPQVRKLFGENVREALRGGDEA